MANVPTQGLSRRKNKRIVIVSTVIVMMALFVTSFGIPRAQAASNCTVAYTANQWPGGFTASINITNSSATPLTAWSLTFTFPAAGQQEVQGWSANWSQAGQVVTAGNLSYNGNLATGATTNIGFNGAWTGSNPAPTNFAINGSACNGSPVATPTPGTTPVPTTQPTPVPTTPPTPGPTPVPTTVPTPGPTPAPGTHVVNPYVGAKSYVNPQWSAEVAAGGGAKIAGFSTAVWLDSMSAIAPATGMGLQAHLDAAVTQAAGAPLTVEFVIYDLPGRDCAALASNGEIPAGGLTTYETQYINPIAAIMSNPKYSGLRIVTIIEPDSLPNLITNLNLARCAQANSSGDYVQGVQYALNKLHAINNVYTYVDAGHSGWLGWPTNFQPAVNLFASVAKGTTAGFASVDGFISNTANYTPTQEPFLPNPNLNVGGSPINSVTFYSFDPEIDELSYDTALRAALISAGFSPNLGMLIDTSRNGWGGAARPTAVSTATDATTYVNQSRIDRRPGRGDWCNQSGAGIGARPAANPLPGIAAFVWIKPPGESDGSSSLIPTGPNNPGGKGFDAMCDPNYGGNALNNNQPSGALPNSPVSGAFFQAQLTQLIQNAFPAL